MKVRTIESVGNALTSSHPDRRTYTFRKEADSWYIDLPEYLEQGGKREDLQMKSGTHKLLTLLAGNKHTATLTIDTAPFAGADVLELMDHCDAPRGGAIYLMETCGSERVNTLLWICDIALFVFGDMPEHIYIRREKHSAAIN